MSDINLTEKQTNLVIGCFYEKPDGVIAYIYGSQHPNCLYYTLNDRGEVSKEEVLTKWKIRRDIYDFPGTKDPKLPPDLYSVFDLYYDIKYYSQLYYALDGMGDFGSIKRITKTMKEENLTKESIEEILINHNYDFPYGKI